jgi:phosphoserine phosphatase RsbU/P
MLDEFTLRVVFALTAVVLLALFVTSFRMTRSRYSLGWASALAFLLAGAALFLLIGTEAQVWAVPTGNALTVIGLMWAWKAVRSLRVRSLRWWHFIVPAVLVGAASALDEPATNGTAGALALAVVSAAIMALAARDLLLLDSRASLPRWSLLVGASALGLYYVVQIVAYLLTAAGVRIGSWVSSDATTTVVTELVLVVVSFGMAELSHDEVTARLRDQADRSSSELDEGAEVQHSLMPDAPLVAGDYEVAGVCVASRALSGDFYDWTQSRGSLVISVGDVMGKGAGAAMLGATIRAGLRLAESDDPAVTVSRVMAAVGADLTRNGAFATLFHARLEEATGLVTIVDAGHGLAVIARSDGRLERIRSTNLPLGLDIPLPDEQERRPWRTSTVTLEVGDRLLVFSDGVLDLFDGTVESVRRAAEIALLTDAPGGTDMRDAVARIRALAELTEHDDDVTVVALERGHPARVLGGTSRDDPGTLSD